MKATHFAALIVISLATTTTTFAEEPPTTPLFKAVDVNTDGSLDKTEFEKVTAAGIEKKFVELDNDKDGKLSKSEYAALDEDCE